MYLKIHNFSEGEKFLPGSGPLCVCVISTAWNPLPPDDCLAPHEPPCGLSFTCMCLSVPLLERRICGLVHLGQGCPPHCWTNHRCCISTYSVITCARGTIVDFFFFCCFLSIERTMFSQLYVYICAYVYISTTCTLCRPQVQTWHTLTVVRYVLHNPSCSMSSQCPAYASFSFTVLFSSSFLGRLGTQACQNCWGVCNPRLSLSSGQNAGA